MTIYIDPPTWPGHGRMWSHLVSDVSFEELHAFAASIGCPPRAFERDHYDVPEAHYADAVRAGAREVGSKEIVRRITDAGLRRPKGRPASPASPPPPPSPGAPGAPTAPASQASR
ncbi:DUF4031 domain-containing protein [Streptomyces sp. NBC_01012]|uniref:DUF4031 domain-containing protein n=1 Tax=Streptomyces sp. NBC_01012 TaxID=2903717 RepID=UPI003870BB06|nr:DUF4031 domain-containing protein [Streptomyces sp. NBC_01012]